MSKYITLYIDEDIEMIFLAMSSLIYFNFPADAYIIIFPKIEIHRGIAGKLFPFNSVEESHLVSSKLPHHIRLSIQRFENH